VLVSRQPGGLVDRPFSAWQAYHVLVERHSGSSLHLGHRYTTRTVELLRAVAGAQIAECPWTFVFAARASRASPPLLEESA